MKINALILFFCIAASAIRASTGSESFLYSKVLKAPDSISSEIGVFRIDEEIYERTANNFPDLRVFDNNGKEVPFLVRYVTVNDTDTIQYSVDLKMEKFVELPKNRIAIIFKSKESDSVCSELFILTTLINFEKSVSVYGSNDKKRWHLLADKQPIFDYSQYVDIRNTTVSFEKKKFNYYKVTVENVWEDKRSPFSQIITESEEGKIKKKYNSFKQQQEPFRLEKISFSGYSQNIRYGKRQTSMYQLAILYSVEDTVKKITEVYLSSKREPLRKLTLKIKGSNFKRYIVVEGTNDTTDDPQWRQIVSSEIYSISAGEFSREEVGISFGESCRYIKYRLKIINKDNTPIEVEAVTAEGDIHEVLLFHRNRRNLKVHYSSNEAKAPVYDVASVLEKTPVVKGNLWKLGSQIEIGIKPKKEPFIKSKHILIIALVLMVVVLSGVLFMTVGKVEEKTRSENTEEQ